jgi:hypothetical protein
VLNANPFSGSNLDNAFFKPFTPRLVGVVEG